MSPEIGSSKAFIERRGGPAYDWDQSTLTLDAGRNALDLSSIVPPNALWVKFRIIFTADITSRFFSLRPTTAMVPPSVLTAYSVLAPLPSTQELFLKLTTPQSCAYSGSPQITALTLVVLGWML